MKKIYTVALLPLFLLGACFDDEGSYDYSVIEEITIQGMETGYSKNMGDSLNIPITTAGYDDMSYTWYIWNATAYSDQEMEVLSQSKDLAYEVNLKPGVYTIMLKATAGNGYSAMQTASLEVKTTFQRGFYLLKADADGNSELDFFDYDGQLIGKDLLKTTGQGAVNGAPLLTGPLYGHGYINPENNNLEYCNAIFITTQTGQTSIINTNDLSKLQDNSNIVYEGLPENTIPYLAFTSEIYNYYLTSAGIYSSCNCVDLAMHSSAYVYDSGNGGSAWATRVNYNGIECMMFWNNHTQSIDYSFLGYGNGSCNENGYSTTGMECLMCGATQSSSKCYFLLKDATGQKYLYRVNTEELMTEGRTAIDATSKFGQATCYAVNAKTADYLYYVYDNRLYIYDLHTDDEGTTPVALQGITSGEEIVYLAYQWMYCRGEKTDFKHLMVGTQEGDTYRVRMYNIEGGVPTTLVRTLEGKGKVKSVAYITPRYDNSFWGTTDSFSYPN